MEPAVFVRGAHLESLEHSGFISRDDADRAWSVVDPRSAAERWRDFASYVLMPAAVALLVAAGTLVVLTAIDADDDARKLVPAGAAFIGVLLLAARIGRRAWAPLVATAAGALAVAWSASFNNGPLRDDDVALVALLAVLVAGVWWGVARTAPGLRLDAFVQRFSTPAHTDAIARLCAPVRWRGVASAAALWLVATGAALGMVVVADKNDEAGLIVIAVVLIAAAVVMRVVGAGALRTLALALACWSAFLLSVLLLETNVLPWASRSWGAVAAGILGVLLVPSLPARILGTTAVLAFLVVTRTFAALPAPVDDVAVGFVAIATTASLLSSARPRRFALVGAALLAACSLAELRAVAGVTGFSLGSATSLALIGCSLWFTHTITRGALPALRIGSFAFVAALGALFIEQNGILAAMLLAVLGRRAQVPLLEWAAAGVAVAVVTNELSLSFTDPRTVASACAVAAVLLLTAAPTLKLVIASATTTTRQVL